MDQPAPLFTYTCDDHLVPTWTTIRLINDGICYQLQLNQDEYEIVNWLVDDPDTELDLSSTQTNPALLLVNEIRKQQIPMPIFRAHKEALENLIKAAYAGLGSIPTYSILHQMPKATGAPENNNS